VHVRKHARKWVKEMNRRETFPDPYNETCGKITGSRRGVPITPPSRDGKACAWQNLVQKKIMEPHYFK
jgi:hypothetical protein